MVKYEKMQELLSKRAELQATINLFPYDGTPEIKIVSNKKYIYIRKRVLTKITSTYVGEFNETLYNQLLKNNFEAKKLKKEIRNINKELVLLGYIENKLDKRIILNIEFAKSNMKNIIYDQAVLEGIATTFPDTEAIIDNGKVNNVKAEDVQKILNLKHAWEFILDKDVATSKTDYYLSSYIAKIINEGFYLDGGRIRSFPVTIGGTNYIPPIPMEFKVKEKIDNILNSKTKDIDKAIELCLYVMKTQIFNDGNKRTAVIFANHYLISKGLGLLVIDYAKINKFKKLLINYYEDKYIEDIKSFLRSCILKVKSR